MQSRQAILRREGAEGRGVHGATLHCNMVHCMRYNMVYCVATWCTGSQHYYHSCAVWRSLHRDGARAGCCAARQRRHVERRIVREDRPRSGGRGKQRPIPPARGGAERIRRARSRRNENALCEPCVVSLQDSANVSAAHHTLPCRAPVRLRCAQLQRVVPCCNTLQRVAPHTAVPCSIAT